jgi:hypothetical protein
MACHLPAPLFRPAFPRAAARAFALSAAVCLSLAVSVAGPSGMALAQPVPPPKLEPLPEIPPPDIAPDPELEPQVTITRRENETIEEARVAGRVVWIKVTPRHGRPYFLVPGRDGETYLRRDSLDSGLRVPLWILFSF